MVGYGIWRILSIELENLETGEVRFAWGDDGHSTLPAPAELPTFSWQSKAPRKVSLNPKP